jgi:hypothetical protein
MSPVLSPVLPCPQPCPQQTPNQYATINHDVPCPSLCFVPCPSPVLPLSFQYVAVLTPKWDTGRDSEDSLAKRLPALKAVLAAGALRPSGRYTTQNRLTVLEVARPTEAS